MATKTRREPSGVVAKGPTRLEAERLCREFPDVPSRTLARRLSKSHKITVESARDYVRKVRGNAGDEKRKHATSPRPNGIAGAYKPQLPPSQADPWEPFVISGEQSIAVLSDAHIPYHHSISIESAVKWCKARKPSILLLNGDWADFYSISRHQKDPSKRDLESEIVAVRESLAWLRHQFPKCRFLYKLGNHEERWQHWLWNSLPELSASGRMDVKEWLECDKFGIEVISDQRPIRVGKLAIFHGHEFGRGGIAAPVNPARGAFLRTNKTVLVGHSHRSSQHSDPDWEQLETSCWSTGCLCDMRPEYARVNKWNYGFAFVELAKDGEFHVDNMRMSLQGKVW